MELREEITLFKKLKAWLNPKYTKIAIYTIVSALIIFGICLLIYKNTETFGSIYALLGALIKPIVLGTMIAYVLVPLVKLLEDKLFAGLSRPKLRRNLSVLLIFLVIAAALAFAIALLAITISRRMPSFHFTDLRSFIDFMATQFADFWKVIEDKLAEFNITLGSVGKTAAGLFSNIKSAGSTLLFAVIFAIYFLLDLGIGTYWVKVSRILFKADTRRRCKAFIADADVVFSGYIRGQALDALIMGCMVTIAFMIARIPYAAVIGILTGVGNLIPFVGPVMGFASLIIVCFSTGAFGKMIIGAVILVVILAVDGNLINPRLLSKSVDIHPILVFLALIAGGQAGGLVGMLVAVPFMALLKQQFEKYLEKRKQNQSEKQTEAQTGMQTEKQTEEQAEKQTEEQAGKAD